MRSSFCCSSSRDRILVFFQRGFGDMKNKYICVLTLNIYIVLLILASVVSGNFYKPMFNTSFTRENKNYYADFFQHKVTWDEADATCKVYNGYVLQKLPNGSPINDKLEKEGVDFLWTGIRRRASYYLRHKDYQDIFKLKDTWKSKEDKWHAHEDFLFDCVVLDFQKNELMTKNCSELYAFVCESEKILKENTAGCPEKWFLSPPLSITGRKCISQSKSPLPYNEAERFCTSNQSRLALRNEYGILKSRKQLESQKDDQEFWARKDDNSCAIFKNGDNDHGRPPCDGKDSKLLPFVCVRSMETENLTVTIEVGSYQGARDPLQIFPWNSTCENKNFFFCIVNYTKPGLQIQWFKDDIPIKNLNSFNVTLKCDKIDEDFKRLKESMADFPVSQGSYHCEVRIPGSIKTYRSEKLDFFYPDIATYIIDIHGIGRENYADYSESKFFDKMEEIDEVIKNILEKMKNAQWDFKSEQRTGESYSMKLVVFVNRDNDYNDEEAYEKIKKHFEGKASSFPFGKNVSVHSADVCFRSDLKPEERCNGIEWPTTKQVKNVPTEKACLNEHHKFVHRECKGSTVNKAEWSSFDCSVCKEFRKRYQDEIIRCPHGYEKFENQDLCFKIYPEGKTWFDAYKTCSNSSSYLLDETSGIVMGNVKSVWLSLKYSFGKIQGFGQKPINITALLYEKEEILLENIGKESNESHCLSAIQEVSGFKFKFENCSLKMPFVCVWRFYEIRVEHYNDDSIEWHKQNNVESCYHINKTPINLEDAINKCKKYGANLLSGNTDIESYTYLKKFILDRYSKISQCDVITWWMDFEDVIENGMPPNLTYVDWGSSADFNIASPQGIIALYPDMKVHWSLERTHTKLGFICKRDQCHRNQPTQPYIEIKSESNEDALTWLQEVTLKCKSRGWYIFNSISWYKDDIFLDVVLDDTTSYSFDHIRNISEALESQGFYSCSVAEVEKKETVYSDKHLIKIPGFYTFVLSMRSGEVDYLTDCPKYMLSKALYENTALYQCFKGHWGISFNNFHFLVKRPICHSSFVDIIVHVYFKENNDSEERKFEEVQKATFSNFSAACKIENITVKSTVFCSSVEKELANIVLRWPTTGLGRSSFPKQTCLSDGTLIERRCMGDFNSGAVWSNISITECLQTNASLSEELYELITPENMTAHLPQIANLTSHSQSLQSIDVQILTEGFRRVQGISLSPENLEAVVQTVSNMIDVNERILSEVSTSSNRIVGYIEKIASNIDENTHEVNITTKNVLVRVYPLNSNKTNVPNGMYIRNTSSTSSIFNASADHLKSKMQDYEAGVVIPSSLFYKKSNVSDRLVYLILRNIYQTNESVLSMIISVEFHNVSVPDLEGEEVSFMCKLNQEVTISMKKDVECVFWNETAIKWSTDGCHLKSIENNYAFCACNHLTSFTVILRKSPLPGHETPLDYLTYIGGSLSCFGFGMIILTFLVFREWRESVKNKCLFNFSISHFLFLVIYMSGIKKNRGSEEWCKVTAIFLHYFLLSSFAWMLVLAYSVYLSLVKVIGTYIPCLIQKAVAFAWGVPAIIVIIVVSVDHKHYAPDEICWLSDYAFHFALMIPLIVMLIVNYIIFGTIFYMNTCGSSHIKCNQKRQKLIIIRAKALLITSVLLGLSWIFGLLMMGAEGDFQISCMYIFAITTTLQGFLLAVFFIFMPIRSRVMWLNLLTSPLFKTFSSHPHTLFATNQGTKEQ